MSTPSSQIMTAYETHSREANRLLKHYRIAQPKRDFDDFQFSVQQRFYEGVHEAYQLEVLGTLTRKHRKQQNVAEVLGLKDRSSISQMKRYKRMDAIRFTAALYHNPEMTFPSQELAALFGFARATSYIKSIAYGDPSLEGAMTAEDFSYLVGLLANPQWYPAIQAKDYSKVRELAEQIVSERTITFSGPIQRGRIRPEQFVLMLQYLWLSWSDFGIIALSTIPELIPKGKEA